MLGEVSLLVFPVDGATSDEFPKVDTADVPICAGTRFAAPLFTSVFVAMSRRSNKYVRSQ